MKIKIFQNSKYRDNIKIKYCNTNNIPLLIRDYTQKNIGEIIYSFYNTVEYELNNADI